MTPNNRSRRAQPDPNRPRTVCPSEPPEPLLRSSDLGRVLALGRTQTWALLNSGAIPRVDVAPPGAKRPSWRVRQSDLEAFLASRKVA